MLSNAVICGPAPGHTREKPQARSTWPTTASAPASSPEGTSISLTGTVTDPGSADTHTYAWSVTKNGVAYASGSSGSFSFNPDDDGSYVVTLVVTDDDGGTGIDAKTIAVTNHGALDYMVITNSGWWDGLPEDVRAGLQKAMAGATEHANKLAAEINDRDQKRIAEAGKAKIQTLSKEDVAAWRTAMHPVWEKFQDQIGKDIIDAAVASNQQ